MSMNERLEKAAAALRGRGFETLIFNTGAQAVEYVRKDIPQGNSVAFGGSMTAKQLGLSDLMREDGHTVLWHWEAAPENRPAVLREAMLADTYICSANALTDDGLMVQIDGTGNRVAAMCYGPKTVYVLIGRNKLVSGGYAQAVSRIKQVACPANARRLGLATPCAETGKCNAGACKRSMCHAFLALEGAPTGNHMKVILIDEELGY